MSEQVLSEQVPNAMKGERPRARREAGEGQASTRQSDQGEHDSYRWLGVYSARRFFADVARTRIFSGAIVDLNDF